MHSDQLSVELTYQGKWLLSEAGTSIYGDGPERAFERSGAAHNVLQLGLALPSGEIDWIEPVESVGWFSSSPQSPTPPSPERSLRRRLVVLPLAVTMALIALVRVTNVVWS